MSTATSTPAVKITNHTWTSINLSRSQGNPNDAATIAIVGNLAQADNVYLADTATSTPYPVLNNQNPSLEYLDDAKLADASIFGETITRADGPKLTGLQYIDAVLNAHVAPAAAPATTTPAPAAN